MKCDQSWLVSQSTLFPSVSLMPHYPGFPCIALAFLLRLFYVYIFPLSSLWKGTMDVWSTTNYRLGKKIDNIPALQVVQWLKNPLADTGDTKGARSIPGAGRSPEEGKGKFHSSFLPGESHDRRSCGPSIREVTKSWTQLSTHTKQNRKTGS